MSITFVPTLAPDRLVVAITGASGAPYAKALLDTLTRLPGWEIHLIVSATAMIVMKEEMSLEFEGGRFDLDRYLGRPPCPGGATVIRHPDADLAAPPASGSFRHRGMIICPCSMKTLATIAHGTGGGLVARAADACLKERRRLVVVPRETPLNLIHLRNMTALAEAGATILPAMPGFYHRPETLADIVRFLVMKILDAAGVEHASADRWKDPGP